jgi:hypothetical protein
LPSIFRASRINRAGMAGSVNEKAEFKTKVKGHINNRLFLAPGDIHALPGLLKN